MVVGGTVVVVVLPGVLAIGVVAVVVVTSTHAIIPTVTYAQSVNEYKYAYDVAN